MSKILRQGFCLVAALGLGACNQQSTYHRPVLAMSPTWQQPTTGLNHQETEVWWKGFNDSQLNRLVEAVLAANPDMAIAGFKLKNAMLKADLADTTSTPSTSTSIAASSTKNLKTGNSVRNWGQSLSMNYEIDFWGHLAAARDQASWEAQASEQDLAATRLMLINKTLEQYWQLAYLGSAITLGEHQILNYEYTERLTWVRYEAGVATQLDLAQVSQQKAGKQAELASLIQQRVQAANVLRLLLGRNSGQLEFVPTQLTMEPIPTLAVGIPADVLARRPDVRAAELRLREILAKEDEIRTSFYPTLSLTGEASASSNTLSKILKNPMGSLGATIVLPFLEYNKTRLSIASSQVDYQIAEAEFRKQLYSALLEVEDGLIARQQGEQRLHYLEQQFGYAKKAEQLAHARYQEGDTGVQPWLDEQNRLWDAELSLLGQQQLLLNTMAGLYRALGGSDQS